ncbi:S8 family peptidase [Streptomyces sp. A1547]|uniref:S8 family peptidase n=1 Tax=Streptomyces sp. A1547 TaxID=2563105 RepID=UPI0023F34D78|nr:S8 family peptidase [Streptomyces sp. A1547]
MCAAGGAWAADQQEAPWGLARISQRGPVGPGPWTYRFNGDGSGVTVYVLDTGIDVKNPEFEGRARFGARFVSSDDTDCNGRGTHLSGTVGAKTYGVAKKASLVAVKVADCDGNATTGSLRAGINWAVSDKRGVKGNVILIGVTQQKSSALNQAVQAAHAKGFVVVVGAGPGGDACSLSPASAPEAVTVGATTKDDKLLSASSHGKCVDVLGPGEDTVSTWTGGPGATRTESGTAMAAAHVAGVAAYYLSQGSITSSQVTAKIVSSATKDAVTGLPAGTPNLLVHNSIS